MNEGISPFCLNSPDSISNRIARDILKFVIRVSNTRHNIATGT